MTKLAKAILAFCAPKVTRWTTALGEPMNKTLECPAWPCGGSLELPTKKEFQHGSDCPASMLLKLGDSEDLHKNLAVFNHGLDYEGGGYHSCPTCKGRTLWQGSSPRHKKNCPGAIAHKTSRPEWIRSSGGR